MTLLGIAFVVAIIATGLFYGLVVSKLKSAEAAKRDTIVVAAQDLAPGHVLAPNDVTIVPRGTVDVLANGFESPTDVAGLVVMSPVSGGAPLERASLASPDSPRGAALGIPPGQRAVSVHVADSTGVVRLLQPGHRVDAQLVTAGRGRQGTLRTMLQNLEVLRVEEEPEASEGRPILPVVTLLATPEEADALAVADAEARIRLLMRHPLDDELTARESVGIDGVFRNPPRQARRENGTSVSEGPGSGKAGGGGTVEAAIRRDTTFGKP